MTLEIRLFGGLLLESGGRVIPRIPSRVGRSLLAYLVLNRDKELSRDLVAGTFWPDMTDNQARRRLSQSLWQIQTHLSESQVAGQWLTTTPDSVRFNPETDYWLDVEMFDDLELKSADIDQLSEALELYRGDLMAGDYEDWLSVPQQNWRDKFIEALSSLVRHLKAAGRFEEALASARRLTLHQPLREEAHREVMRLCYLCGRPNEALLQYEICYSTLQDELGAEPELETTALFESIAADRQATPFLPKPGSPLVDGDQPIPLVGRGQERAIATSMMEAALRGQGGVLLVEGPPGIGKSRLADSLADDASWRGLIVVRDQGSGEAVSFGPLLSGLERALTTVRIRRLEESVEEVWLQRLCQLIPSLTDALTDSPTDLPAPSLRPAEEVESVREAITRILIALAGDAPLVIIVDDFDAIDEDSAAVLNHLGNVIGSHAILLVVSFDGVGAQARPPVWDAIRAMDGLNSSRRLTLNPLSEEETAELIRLSSATEIGTAAAAAVHADTGGNPLFILETIRAQHDHRVAAINEDQIEEPPIPSSIAAAVQQRLASLTGQQRSALEALAVIGLEASAGLISAVADRQIPDLAEDLEILKNRGLLQRTEDCFSFRHRQVLQVVYDQAPETAALHESMAEALVAGGEPIDHALVATHFAAAGQTQEAASNFEVAAQQSVAVAAYATAALQFRASIENTAGGEPQVEFRRLAGLETVLDVLGERDEQAHTIRRMEALGLEDRISDCLRRKAWLEAQQDHFAQASLTASQAVDLDTDQPAMLAEDYRIIGMTGLWSGNVHEAIDNLEKAAALADGSSRAVVTEALGRALGAAQRYEEATVQTERALGLFVIADDRRGQAEALGSLGIINMERGRAEESLGFYSRAIDVCSTIGYRHGVGVNTVNLANALWSLGRLGEALGHFEAAIEIFTGLGNRRGMALTQANSASLYVAIGDLDQARQYCHSAIEYFEQVSNVDGVAQVRCTLGDIHAAEGQYDQGRHELHRALESLRQTGNHWLEIQALDSIAALELVARDWAEAESLASAGLAISEQFGLDDFAANLRSIRALAVLNQGRRAEAVADSTSAVKALDSSGHPDHLILHRHAQVIAESDPAGSRVHMQQAQSALEKSLQGLDAEQLDRALAAFSFDTGTITVILASASAPTGRPLHENEMIEVTWTTAPPPGSPSQSRRLLIVQLLEAAADQGAAPTVEDLSAALQVSVRTIRRDLHEIRRGGTEAPTRGSR